METYRIERFDIVVSTNEIVKRGIDRGSGEGLVCRALEQTGGYGRQGRVWASPRGGLYQSVLLRPKVRAVQLPSLSLVVALSVRQALVSCGGLLSGSVQVKWPNDVVCEQGKLAGVSLESHAGGVCVGIGANVWHPSAPVTLSGKNAPAYLVDIARNGLGAQPGGREIIDRIGDDVLNELRPRYDLWQREGFAPFLDEFNACNALSGRRVTIVDRNGGEVASGPVAGVDEDGNLLVGGRAIASGEAHIQ